MVVSVLPDLSEPLVIEPPMRALVSRELEFAAPAWPLPATPDCDTVGADGRLRSLDLRVSISDLRFSIGDRELGAWVLIGLPIREVRPELTRLLELALELFVELDGDGVLTVIGLPIREVKSELIRPFEFEFPDCRPVFRLEALRLEPGDEDLPRFKELPAEGRLTPEDGDEIIGELGVREDVIGLEVMLLDELPELVMLREGMDMPGRDDIEVPGLIILLELVGGCMDREMVLLEGRLIRLELDRPIDGELVGARLMLGGALTLGAGAGAGAGRETCRLDAELPPPELELFRSALSPNTDSQSRIKTEMSVRIPILVQCLLATVRPLFAGLELPGWYSFAFMMGLLSANGSTQVFYSNYKRL